MDRLNVAICEDDPRDAAALRDILAKTEIPLTPYFFSDCASLKAAFTSGFFQIVLLDILFDGKPKGINLAKTLHKNDKDLWVIFTTVCPDFAIDGYAVEAKGYLLKPIDTKEIEKLLSKAYRHFREAENSLEIIVDYHHVTVPVQDILSIQAKRNQSLIHLADSTLVTNKSIGDLEAKLPQLLFLRTHRSFLVNLAHVQRMDGERRLFVMDNNATVKVGAKNCTEAFGAYHEYLGYVAVL